MIAKFRWIRLGHLQTVLIAFVRTLSAVILLSACSTAIAAPQTKLMVWGMQSGADTQDMDAEIAAFEKTHPDIKVSTLSMGAGAMNPQKLMTAIVGGVPPDLVQQDRFTIGDWASRGAFLQLDGLLKQDGVSKSPYAVREGNFVLATWKEATYDGHVYAIPNGMDDRLLFYNKALFRKAGIDPNRPPRTWSEMIEAAKRLTVRDSSGQIQQLGLDPTYGQGWLYLWSWQEDGDAMSVDGRHCTVNNPRTVEALRNLVSWYDDLGGINAIRSFEGGFGSDEQDPFLTGKLAMRIDGNGIISTIARYEPDLDFGVAPVPVPDARYFHQGIFKHDSTWVTWSGGFSYAIPRGAKHVKQAWELIQWLTSPQAALIGANALRSYDESVGRMYIPGLSANISADNAVFGAFRNDLKPKYEEANSEAVRLLGVTKFRPVTFVGQLLWDEQVRAVEAALRHTLTPHQALNQAQENVQVQLDEELQRDKSPELPADVVLGGAIVLSAVLIIAAAIGIATWMRGRRRAARAEGWMGMLFILPWALGFIVLTVGPIVASLVISFCNYDVLHPARWVGARNYVDMFTTDHVLVLKSLGNAAYLAVIGIPLGMATGLSMAMLVNNKVRGINWYRTAFYIPSIVPTVATSVLWAYLLNSDPHRGLINSVWQETLTHWFHVAPPGWEAVPEWSKPGMIVMGLWGAGGGMIIWLAGLQSIPRTLYEAASLDGAGWWSQFKHVTVPILSPYIFFNLIMGTIGALQTFETSYILGGTDGGGGTGPDDSLLVPVVYLFNNAFQYFKMGYASALAWLLFVVILGLTLGQVKLAPRWVHYESEDK